MQETLLALYDNIDQVYLTIGDLLNAGLTSEEIGIAVADISKDYSGMVTGDIKGDASAGFGAILRVMTDDKGAGLAVETLSGTGTIILAGTLHPAKGHLHDVLDTCDVPPAEQDVYLEGLRRGYVLLTLTTRQDTATIIEDLLNRHQPVDAALLRQHWQREGWQAFDAAAPAYTPDDTEHERRRYRLFVAGQTTSEEATVKRHVITG